MKTPISLLFLAASFAPAADIQGDWIAELSAKGADPQYARVKLHLDGASITGTWNQLTLTGTATGDVELLICATTTPDFVFPSSANLICDMAGIRGVGSFDVQAACSGFVYALSIASQFIETGKFKKIVVVGADKMSSIIDYTDRATCVLFGDGAGAVLLEPAEEGEDGIIDFVAQIEGVGGQYLNMPGGGSLHPASHETVDQKMHYIHQDGQQVFKYAVKKMSEMTERLLQKNKLTGGDIDCFIAHQANKRIIMATADRLKMPIEKVIINIDRYGNTTAGTIPIAMHTALSEGKLKKGDMVLLAAVGAGFTSGATLLRWAF